MVWPVKGSGSSGSMTTASSSPSSPVMGELGGAKTRLISSFTSLSIASSVTMQFCPTVAEISPSTRTPSEPWRATPNVACNRGSDRRPAVCATSARVASSATRSNRLPPSGMSEIATGTLQGSLLAGLCVALFGLIGIASKSLRVGKADPALRQTYRFLLRKLNIRRLNITGQALGAFRFFQLFPKYIARQSVRQRGVVVRGQSRIIGRCAAIKGLTDPLHMLWHRQIAHAHFTQIGVHIIAKSVEYPLAQPPHIVRPGAAAANNQKGVDEDHFEPAGDRIRYAKTAIEGWRTRLRHDRAIERMDGILLGGAAKKAEF